MGEHTMKACRAGIIVWEPRFRGRSIRDEREKHTSEGVAGRAREKLECASCQRAPHPRVGVRERG